MHLLPKSYDLVYCLDCCVVLITSPLARHKTNPRLYTHLSPLTETPRIHTIMASTVNWPRKYLPGKTDNFVSNETYVVGITAAQVWEFVVDVSQWDSYYENIGRITPPSTGPRLEKGDSFSFATFGFPPLHAQCEESVTPTATSPGRLGWRAWQEGDESTALDIYHAWILEDMEWGAVRILTQESQIGKPAAELAVAKPNPMLNGHQAWIEGLAKITKARNQ